MGLRDRLRHLRFVLLFSISKTFPAPLLAIPMLSKLNSVSVLIEAMTLMLLFIQIPALQFSRVILFNTGSDICCLKYELADISKVCLTMLSLSVSTQLRSNSERSSMSMNCKTILLESA